MKKHLSISPFRYAAILALCSFFLSNAVMAQNRNRSVPALDGPAVMIKLNATDAISGLYTGGLELRTGKRASFFADGGWIQKNNENIATEGYGVEGGMRIYTNLNKRIRKGKASGKFAHFSGNYFSLQGRYGQLRDWGSESAGFDYEFKKVAVHYGMQRAWKHIFLNVEAGPSFGGSDFDQASGGHFERYYLNDFNFDAKVTLGLAF
jgi:hypothetical protein